MLGVCTTVQVLVKSGVPAIGHSTYKVMRFLGEIAVDFTGGLSGGRIGWEVLPLNKGVRVV